MTDPIELDCQAAADRLHELIDQELTPEIEAAVQHHLDECAPCMAVYEFEQGFRRFMSLKMQSVEMPRDLKTRITQKLSEEKQQAPDK
jgi:mycothiol system anti-sigma-R factor